MVPTSEESWTVWLYPLTGTTLARLWYEERITRQATVGILVLGLGAVTIFTPGLWDSSPHHRTRPGSGSSVALWRS